MIHSCIIELNTIKLILMSGTDTNLLSFLKKQSLFNSSPNKNLSRRRSSRSKERSSDYKASPIKNVEQGFDENNGRRKFVLEGSEHSFAGKLQNNGRVGGGLQDSRFGQFQDNRYSKPQQYNTNNGLNGFTRQIIQDIAYQALNFQSARVESAHCLQNLAVKLKNEVNTINVKIDNFNNKIHKVISAEFKNLRERIYYIIQQSFKESQIYIRQYVKSQEDKLAVELIRMREELSLQYNKIQLMREEIYKPTWRKTAGQIIATELQKKIGLMVEKSSSIQIKNWEIGDLIGYRLKDLQRDLREMVKLKRDQKGN